MHAGLAFTGLLPTTPRVARHDRQFLRSSSVASFLLVTSAVSVRSRLRPWGALFRVPDVSDLPGAQPSL